MFSAQFTDEQTVLLSFEKQVSLLRCSRMERDLRQKRQLLDAQRDKMRTLTQQAADNQTKVVSTIIATHTQ